MSGSPTLSIHAFSRGPPEAPSEPAVPVLLAPFSATAGGSRGDTRRNPQAAGRIEETGARLVAPSEFDRVGHAPQRVRD